MTTNAQSAFFRIYDLIVDSEGRLVMTIPAYGPIPEEVLIQPEVGKGPFSIDIFNHYKKRVKVAEGFVVRPSAIQDFVVALAYHGQDITKGKFNTVLAKGRQGDGLRAMLDFVHLIHCAKRSAMFVLATEGDNRDPREIYAEFMYT